jgi:hypothetical protein
MAARKRVSKTTLFDSFLDFVAANPKLAAMVAFQVGIVAGEAVAAPQAAVRSISRRVNQVPQQIADAMPQGLSAAALKFLPGPSPKLQPRKRGAARPRRKISK